MQRSIGKHPTEVMTIDKKLGVPVIPELFASSASFSTAAASTPSTRHLSNRSWSRLSVRACSLKSAGCLFCVRMHGQRGSPSRESSPRGAPLELLNPRGLIEITHAPEPPPIHRKKLEPLRRQHSSGA